MPKTFPKPSEVKRRIDLAKDKVRPPECECILRCEQPFTSIPLCPMHGNNRAAWRNR